MRFGKFIPSVKEESVQLTDLPEYKNFKNVKGLEEKWNAFLKLRDDVLKALEEARNQKIIGKSLTAKVTLYVTEKTGKLLDTIQENVKQLFIVSDFEVAGTYDDAPEDALKLETSAIVITKAEGERCERCWTVTPDVGKDHDHETLCPRCAQVVKENYSNLA